MLLAEPVAALPELDTDLPVELRARIDDLQLHADPYWLKLLHYQKAFGRNRTRSIVKGGDFFLAPTGATDPLAELHASLNAFLNKDLSSQQKYQCRFLVRRNFLFRRLGIPDDRKLACPQREEWSRSLNARRASIVFASSYLQSPASAFGHTFFKLINPDQKSDLLQYALNFAATTGDVSPFEYALGGLIGSFPGYFSILPYHQKISEYSNIEGRSLWEFPLNLSAEEIQIFLDHIWELQGSHFDYYFAEKNCSYFLLSLLEIARPQVRLTAEFSGITIPLDTLKALEDAGLIANDGTAGFRPALKEVFRQNFEQLSSGERTKFVRAIRKFDADPADTAELADVRTQELATNYYSIASFGDAEAKKNLHRVNLLRAKSRTTNTPFRAPQVPDSPLISHVSSQVFFAGHGGDKVGASVQFRTALHDMLSLESTYPAKSHLEVLSARLFHSTKDKSWEIDRINLIKIAAFQNFDELFRSFSWNSEVTFEDREIFVHGGGGLFKEFDTYFKTAGGIFLQGDLRRMRDRQARLDAGPMVYFFADFTPRIRFMATFENVHYEKFMRTQAEAALSLIFVKNGELRLSHRHTMIDDRITSMGLVWNFRL